MKTIRDIRVFISSPGNVSQERETVAQVCLGINKDLGGIKGFRLDPVRWETHTSSAIAERSQLAISRQIGDYDVYLGVMGCYFGSPTGAYSSGTEEEFRDALNAHRKSGSPEIQFFFSEADVDPDKIDLVQLRKVRDFRQVVADEGIYYRKFKSLLEFETLVRQSLTKVVFDLIDSESSKSELRQVSPVARQQDSRPYEVLKNLNREFERNPEVSAHFLMHESARSFRNLSDRMLEIRRRMDLTTNCVKKALREIGKVSGGSRSANSRGVKLFVEAINQIEEFSFWLCYEITGFQAVIQEGVSSLHRSSIIIKTFPDTKDEDLSEFGSIIDGVALQADSFAETLMNLGPSFPDIPGFWPRWRANRQIFIAATADFSEMLKISSAAMRTTRDLILNRD